MALHPKPSKPIKEPETSVSPEMVQEYIAYMLRELSDMASTSGLTHVSSSCKYHSWLSGPTLNKDTTHEKRRLPVKSKRLKLYEWALKVKLQAGNETVDSIIIKASEDIYAVNCWNRVKCTIDT